MRKEDGLETKRLEIHVHTDYRVQSSKQCARTREVLWSL